MLYRPYALKMASARSKRRDLLACIFITKSISKKLLIKIKYGTRYSRYGIPLVLYKVRDRCKKRVFPLMPVSIYIVIGYDRREVNY